MNKWLTRFVPMLAALTLTIAPSASDTALPSPADLAVEPVAFAYAAKLEKVLRRCACPARRAARKATSTQRRPHLPVASWRTIRMIASKAAGCDWHPSCGLVGDQAMLAAADLIDSLRGSTPAQLASLVERYSHLVQINEARRVLQLIGCNNRIVASYSSQTIPALEALLL